LHLIYMVSSTKESHAYFTHVGHKVDPADKNH